MTIEATWHKGKPVFLVPEWKGRSMDAPRSSIQVEELGAQKFSLTVVFDDQRFDCGTYISRAAAMQAGRLFVQRKEGEQAARKKRPKRKG
jgi:hypothetical protein